MALLNYDTSSLIAGPSATFVQANCFLESIIGFNVAGPTWTVQVAWSNVDATSTLVTYLWQITGRNNQTVKLPDRLRAQVINKATAASAKGESSATITPVTADISVRYRFLATS